MTYWEVYSRCISKLSGHLGMVSASLSALEEDPLVSLTKPVSVVAEGPKEDSNNSSKDRTQTISKPNANKQRSNSKKCISMRIQVKRKTLNLRAHRQKEHNNSREPNRSKRLPKDSSNSSNSRESLTQMTFQMRSQESKLTFSITYPQSQEYLLGSVQDNPLPLVVLRLFPKWKL